jgi:hypothetical protein
MYTYLFFYQFEGHEYGFEIKADTPEEAEARVAVLSSRAKIGGRLYATIPAGIPGAGWFVSAWCAIGNWLKGRGTT